MATKSAQIYEHQRVGARSIQMEPNRTTEKEEENDYYTMYDALKKGVSTYEVNGDGRKTFKKRLWEARV